VNAGLALIARLGFCGAPRQALRLRHAARAVRNRARHATGPARRARAGADLDGERGRGALLYHRYDGHYGLITPADAGE
jgi:hypothetical protein